MAILSREEIENWAKWIHMGEDNGHKPSEDSCLETIQALLKVAEAARSAINHFEKVCDHPCSSTKNLLKSALSALAPERSEDEKEKK